MSESLYHVPTKHEDFYREIKLINVTTARFMIISQTALVFSSLWVYKLEVICEVH